MLREAVKDRLIIDNPFADIRTGGEVNRSRDAFVSRDTAAESARSLPRCAVAVDLLHVSVRWAAMP